MKSERSKAVIACDGGGGGCLLFWWGEAIAGVLEGGGSGDLASLSLDDAPFGISVWEGSYDTVRCGEGGIDYDIDRIGDTFREPNAEEWDRIRQGRNPWVDETFVIVRYDTVDNVDTVTLCGWLPAFTSEAKAQAYVEELNKKEYPETPRDAFYKFERLEVERG